MLRALGLAALFMLLPWASWAQQSSVAQLPSPEQLQQAQSLINQVQRHFNICLQNSAVLEVANTALAQENAALKKRLEAQAPPVASQSSPPPAKEADAHETQR